MKKLLIFILLASVLVFTYFLISQTNKDLLIPSPLNQQQNNKIIATNLDTPWALAFLPDNSILITQRSGIVRLIDNQNNLKTTPVAVIPSVEEIGEGGLLGITIHPRFSSNNYVYLYYTYSGSGDNTLNRVIRMTYKNQQLTDEKIIVDNIPGASNHNGGRIKFGPDNYLYITTGDAQNPSQAQDRNSLSGKILRVTDEGKPVKDNPFNNLVYSYGHRNPQGLAWDDQGNLWATEHGRSGVLSGLDELNLIKMGKNYGWPVTQGDEKNNGMETPVLHSENDTWAPASLTFLNNQLFFGGLRGQALYSVNINNINRKNLETQFKNQYGRIREVIAGPDGSLYLTTSNRDGRGNPQPNDDKIVLINPAQL